MRPCFPGRSSTIIFRNARPCRDVRPLTEPIKDSTEEAQALEQKSSALKPPAALSTQTTSHPKSQSPGEGIGLSIVKKLCELLDASLEFESQPGEGSTFRIIFPRHYNRS